MNIAFRTDATSQIGTGHFMRCLTLADELKKQGAQIRFISRNLPAYLSEMLSVKGMTLMALNVSVKQEPIDELDHAYWLGTSQTQDAQVTIEALGNQLCDWIVVDHYALDERWESVIRDSCKKLMVIDDLADRKHDCDVLLDQNFYSDIQTRYIDKVPMNCLLLLGPRYALLREEFRTLRETVKVRTGNVKKVLVFFGGVDIDNNTSLAIQALAALNINLHVEVVIGLQHPNLDQIKFACSELGYVCHVQTSSMGNLIIEADLGIGSGGSAMLERCYLGLPTITVVSAFNQEKTTEDMAAIGAIEYIGFSSKIKLIDYIYALKKMIDNPHRIKKISEVGISILQFFGTNAVAREILN